MTKQEILEQLDKLYDTMSTTDQKSVQAAILRAQRKALSKQLKAVKAKEPA